MNVHRRNYWRHDIEVAGRVVGFLMSTPSGFRLHTTDNRLRWLRRRFYRTPGHLIDQARLQALRAR